MRLVLSACISLGFAIGIAGCGPDIEKAHTESTPKAVTPAVAPSANAPGKTGGNGQKTVSLKAGHSEKGPNPPNVGNEDPQHLQSPATQTPRAPRRRVRVTTPFLVKKCINLGNALEAPNEGDWGYRIRAKDFRIIKNAGFDSVRIPVRWSTHTAYRPPYKIDPAFMNRVAQVVDQALSADLQVVLDVHLYEPLMEHTERERPRFVAIWAQIAKRFQNAPSALSFEILNEPTLAISSGQLNSLYKQIFPVIRRTNPNRRLIIGGNSWNSVEGLSKVNFPDDVNLVATFHDYGPHEFTHQGASWIDPPMPVGRKWGGAADKAELADVLAKAHRFKMGKTMPIFVGEFGVIKTVSQAERNEWLRIRRKAHEKAGHAWCVWDYSGMFAIYDVSKERWKPGVLEALLGD